MGTNTNIEQPVTLDMGAQFERVKELPAVLIGAALLLIVECGNEGSLPDEGEVLRRVAKLSKYMFAENRRVLKSLFVVKGGVWKLPEVEPK